MLRHVIDELFNKSIDYFIIDNNKDSKKNNINNKLDSSVENKKITSIVNKKDSLYEDLDWFKKFEDNSNLLLKNLGKNNYYIL